MLTVDFQGVQSCDCCQYSITDSTNYNENPISLFFSRKLIINYGSGEQKIVDFPFVAGNLLVLKESKDFSALITLQLTPITPVGGTLYSKDKNVVSTCKSDQIARNKDKEKLNACDDTKLLFDILDINAGITSAKRLTRLGLIEEAQNVLSYIDKTYGAGCNCGCQ